MQHTQQIQSSPDVFILQKLQEKETTDQNSRIFCDGHFFPVSLQGVPAGDYEQPVYRLTEYTPANGTAEERKHGATA